MLLTKFSTQCFLLILLLFIPIGKASSVVNQKVLFILSADKNGYWLPELLTPYMILTKAGFQVEFASPRGNKGKQAGAEFMNDDEKSLLLKLQPILKQPKALKSIKTSKYAALYVPGGAGPMFDLFNHPEVNRIVANMYENNKPVSADCHGPAAFAAVRLNNGEFMIKGKNVTGKSNAEENNWARENYPFLLENKLTQNAALFSAAPPNQAWIVQDGNLLTGQNPASSTLLAKKLVQMLNSKQ